MVTLSTQTLIAICDAVESFLGDATGIARSQSYDELTEGMNTTPTLAVYPQSGSTIYQRTFRQGVRVTHATIHVDVIAKQRGDLKTDMGVLVPLIDAVQTEIEKEREGYLFDLDNVQWGDWRWERVVFVMAGVEYIGVRFFLDLTIF
jgi:hypothetical protein